MTVDDSSAGGEAKRVFLNLKGETSSHVFLQCKVELEELSPGDIVEILVDDVSATTEVPTCLSEEGHRVLEVQRIGEEVWRLAFEKGKGE